MANAVAGPGCAVYRALSGLGVVPGHCKEITIKIACDHAVTITYECWLIDEIDGPIAEAVISDARDAKSKINYTRPEEL
jgi:hypothetical protein